MPAPTIKIDQALHGYSRGHKELASSVELDADSRASMLIYSDLLASPGPASNDSYITGYPLKSAQRYVLARTWLAGPGVRPGSVWTHSLIFELSALTQIDDLNALLCLFRAPRVDDIASYSDPVHFTEARQAGTKEAAGGDARAMAALQQLYGNNISDDIALPSLGAVDDDLAVALWRQMWPALRRNFAFVSGPATRVAKFDAACSLHFGLATGDARKLVRWPPQMESGYEILGADLWKPGPTELRAYIGRYAIEAAEPRKLAPALAALHAMETREPVRTRLEHIRRLREVSSLPRLVRDTIANELTNSPSQDDLLALVEEYRGQPVPKNLGDIVTPIAQRDDFDLGQLLKATQPSEQGQLGDLLFVSLVNGSAPEALSHAARKGIDRVRLVNQRPELWDIAEFWPAGDEDRAALAKQIGRPLSVSAALDLFPGEIGPKVAILALGDIHNSVSDLLRLLDRCTPDVRSIVANMIIAQPSWIETLAGNAALISVGHLDLFCEAAIRSKSKISSPEAWITLILSANKRGAKLSVGVLIIGYAAAMATAAARALPIAQLTFDPLFRTVRSYRLSGDQERFLSAALPPSARYASFTRSLACSVVEKWHSTGINPQALAISKDDESLKEIIEQLVSRFGRSKFEAALQNKSLNQATLAAFRRAYRPKPKKKKSIWWWDW